MSLAAAVPPRENGGHNEMWKQIASLSDQKVRSALGARFESFVDEAFQIVRWSGMVALADYLARRYPDPWLAILYWLLAALLFGYVASRFLLRPEIRIFASDAPVWKRLLQSAANFFLCIGVFIGVLAAIHAVAEGIVEDRFVR
jgi:hypothetical protein